jgi:hypothetical protein
MRFYLEGVDLNQWQGTTMGSRRLAGVVDLAVLEVTVDEPLETASSLVSLP